MVKLTRAKVIKAIPGCLGIYSTIAEKCGVTRSAISHFFTRHPDLKQMADEDEEKIKDVVQGHINVALNNGDDRYIRWFADTKMKDRGFGQKMQVEGNIQTDMWKDADQYFKKLRGLAKDPNVKKALKEEIWKPSGDTKD